jgi:ankyrin repeat protein
MMAAQYGNALTVKLLLDAGADPALRNQQQLSALDFARKGERADSAELIEVALRASLPHAK